MTTISNFQNNSALPDIVVGEQQDIGVGRSHQEDRVKLFSLTSTDTVKRVLVAAIYDGHNSEAISQLLSTALPAQLLVIFKAHDWNISNQCFEELFQNQEALAAGAFADGSVITGGSTLLLHVLDGSELWTAWVGDSRSCLNKDGLHLSVDHSRTNPVEAARFSEAGVTKCELDVTRALGDIDVKLGTKGALGISPLIAVPEVRMRTIDEQDEFIVMGSDGLWDFFKTFTFTDIRRELRKSNNCQAAAKLACDSALAAHKGDDGKSLTNGDNISVIVIGLKQPAALPTFNKERSRLPPLTLKTEEGGSQSEANSVEISVEEAITREEKEEVLDLPQVIEMETQRAPPILLNNPNAQLLTPAAPMNESVRFYNLLVIAQRRWQEKMEAAGFQLTSGHVKKTYAQALIPGYGAQALKQKAVVGGGGGDGKAQPQPQPQPQPAFKKKKKRNAHGRNRSHGGRNTNSGGSGKKQQREKFCAEPPAEVEEGGWKIAAKKRSW